MKKLFTAKRREEKESPLSFLNEHRQQTLFTPGFFKFLLGFSLIILLSFIILAFAEHASGV